MSLLGRELVESAEEALAIARGEKAPARIFSPGEVDVARIRKRRGLSQRAFADRYGFSPSAVRDWEQGRRRPEKAARTLLLVIDREPEAVARALAQG